MPTIETAAGPLSYSHNGVDWNVGDPVIVLIHGAGGQRADWPLAWRNGSGGLKNLPVYAIDLPGHGVSKSASCETIVAYADAVNAFVEAMEFERVILAGHSMGAAIALEICSRNPPRITGVIQVAGSPDFFVHPKVLNGFLTRFEATVDAIVGFSWPRQARESYKRLQRWHMLVAGSKVVHGDFLACSNFNISDRLADIACPVLVIAAAQDAMVPFDQSVAMHDALANSCLIKIRNSGHFPHVEKQAKCASAIEAFVADIT